MGCTLGKPRKKLNSRFAVNVNDEYGCGIPKGVSVHHLKHVLLEEVNKTPGLGKTSTIYNLEDWTSPDCGIIRQKGEDKSDPIDGRMGASYVDSLSGKDNVGPANLMLSYTWGYEIADIVTTLDEFCRSNKRDPKATYVWMCFLCINQHRVFELNQKGEISDDSTFAQFKKTFEDRVINVGEVICMMSPWHDPTYLSRVWCIFELYTAHKEKCKVSIVMPNREKEKMAKALAEQDGIETLFHTLSSTDIEQAQASVEMDKVRILEMVRNGPGYEKLNNFVNEMLRRWVKEGIMEQVAVKETALTDASTDTDFALFCGQLGIVMERFNDLENALILNKRTLSIFRKVKGEDADDTASAHHNLGRTYQKMERNEEALEELRKVLEIDKKMYGDNHPETASSYTTISEVLLRLKRYDEAMIEAKNGLEIRLHHYGKNHQFTAMSYGQMGLILHQKGDYDAALAEHQKSLDINLEAHGEQHPQTATVYHNIGGAHYEKGDYANALASLEKALAVRKNIVGEDHAHTKDTIWYISNTKEKM